MNVSDPTRKAYLSLHLAVLLFGFSAIFGDLINLPAVSLVWWRLLFTCLSIPLVINIYKLARQTDRRLILKLMGVGVIVALHWITFFGSIKLANASLALVCLATTAFFTALIEPLILKQQWKGYELGLGLTMVPGILLVVDGIPVMMMTGLWLGLISAMLWATFASFNKQMIHQAEPLLITFIELGSGGLFITILLPFVLTAEGHFWPEGWDWIYLIALALLCTTLGYVLALKAMKHLSAFITMLSMNLEPVYGIILAHFLLNDADELTSSFYIGVLIILGSLFVHPFLKRKYK